MHFSKTSSGFSFAFPQLDFPTFTPVWLPILNLRLRETIHGLAQGGVFMVRVHLLPSSRGSSGDTSVSQRPVPLSKQQHLKTPPSVTGPFLFNGKNAKVTVGVLGFSVASPRDEVTTYNNDLTVWPPDLRKAVIHRPNSVLQFGLRGSQQMNSCTVWSQWAQDMSLRPGHSREASSSRTVNSHRPPETQQDTKWGPPLSPQMMPIGLIQFKLFGMESLNGQARTSSSWVAWRFLWTDVSRACVCVCVKSFEKVSWLVSSCRSHPIPLLLFLNVQW